MVATRSKSESTRARRKRAPRVRQLEFPRHGGKRRGAGRKPKGSKPGVSHRSRGPLAARHPVLVTFKVAGGLPGLREPAVRDRVHDALLRAQARGDVRVVHFSIQANHVHALVEAEDARALSRGMQGLAVRIARRLNRLWERSGRVFADRFHSRVLRTPQQVRNALAYVLQNARKHGMRLLGLDAYSSAAAFDGWRELLRIQRHVATAVPVERARSWLLSIGWRRHGLISVDEVPSGDT